MLKMKEIVTLKDNRMFWPARTYASQYSAIKNASGVLQMDPDNIFYSKLWKIPRSSVSKGHASALIPNIKHPVCQLFHKESLWRIFSLPINLEEESSLLPEEDNFNNFDEVQLDDSSERSIPRMTSVELESLLADSERSKLIKKLSEANQYNRFLRRQLQFNEDALINFRSELAILDIEVQAILELAEELAKSGVHQEGSRKINGKYVPSYLLSRIEAVHGRLKEQLKGVDAVRVRDVELLWCGMAETVQIMGSFDGWSQGEHMSPEYTGDHNKFSTVLKLRPGRYEIKFLVDGEWQLSPELPTVGEDPMQNNLLIVE